MGVYIFKIFKMFQGDLSNISFPNENCTYKNASQILLGDRNSTTTTALPPLALVIFGTLWYVVIWPFVVLEFKCIPFGRIAAVLIGSLLMVVTLVLSQDEVYAILGEKDHLQTLCLLLGMMMFAFYIEREGLLSFFLKPIMKTERSFYAILWLICLMSGVLSALITNDATCVMLTPLILQEHIRQKRRKHEYLPILLGIATSANIGSAATVMGNPQNAYIAATQGINLAQTFLSLFPAALIGLVVNTGLLYLYTYFYFLYTQKKYSTVQYQVSKQLTKSLLDDKSLLKFSASVIEELKQPAKNKYSGPIFWSLIIFLLIATVVLLSVPADKSVHFDLGLVPVGCASILMIIDGVLNKQNSSRIVRHVDWGVILLFCGLFVWLGGFKKTNIPRLAFLSLKQLMNINTFGGVMLFTLFITVGSNLLSNVPMVILIVDYIHCLPSGLSSNLKESNIVASLLLAWVSTIAGNFTLIGSVANLIVAEKAKRHVKYSLGFFSYLLFGFFSTIIVLFIGLPIVYFTAREVSKF